MSEPQGATDGCGERSRRGVRTGIFGSDPARRHAPPACSEGAPEKKTWRSVERLIGYSRPFPALGYYGADMCMEICIDMCMNMHGCHLVVLRAHTLFTLAPQCGHHRHVRRFLLLRLRLCGGAVVGEQLKCLGSRILPYLLVLFVGPHNLGALDFGIKAELAV